MPGRWSVSTQQAPPAPHSEATGGARARRVPPVSAVCGAPFKAACANSPTVTISTKHQGRFEVRATHHETYAKEKRSVAVVKPAKIMSRFLSGFWGGNQQQAEEGQSSTATGSTSATTGAASWITMNDPPGGGRGEPVMAVNKSTVDDVLDKLGDEGAVNVVAIFGAARGGKSFLMNQLAGQDDIFKISNDKVSCCH